MTADPARPVPAAAVLALVTAAGQAGMTRAVVVTRLVADRVVPNTAAAHAAVRAAVSQGLVVESGRRGRMFPHPPDPT